MLSNYIYQICSIGGYRSYDKASRELLSNGIETAVFERRQRFLPLDCVLSVVVEAMDLKFSGVVERVTEISPIKICVDR